MSDILVEIGKMYGLTVFEEKPHRPYRPRPLSAKELELRLAERRATLARRKRQRSAKIARRITKKARS
jgi:hypothetical protein